MRPGELDFAMNGHFIQIKQVSAFGNSHAALLILGLQGWFCSLHQPQYAIKVHCVAAWVLKVLVRLFVACSSIIQGICLIQQR